MTPEEYFEAFTLGNYNDFIDDSSSVMRAFNSAVSASHLADCYYSFYKKHQPSLVIKYKNLAGFINSISQNTNNYFQDIRSIANAYKHLYTGTSKEYARYSTISSAGTIESVTFDNEEINQVSEEPIDKNASGSMVVYTRKTGEQIQFKQAIDTVVKFWETTINKTKIGK
ncbi:MAG: hypothetical protein JW870_04090 [Candidatus Delongbacteria bacterium]|nr:hypothetical protein [Candidatus Delongbacteria bacterium]